MCCAIYRDTGMMVWWRDKTPKERQTDGMKSADLFPAGIWWTMEFWCCDKLWILHQRYNLRIRWKFVVVLTDWFSDVASPFSSWHRLRWVGVTLVRLSGWLTYCVTYWFVFWGDFVLFFGEFWSTFRLMWCIITRYWLQNVLVRWRKFDGLGILWKHPEDPEACSWFGRV